MNAYRKPGIVAAAAILLCSCAAPGTGPEDDALVVTDSAPTVLNIDDFVADELGFYAEHGVSVRRQTTGTAAQSVQLLATGDADIGRGLSNSVQARVRTSGELDFIDVADPVIRPPHAMVSAGITRWEDLIGTPVGITSATDQGTIVTQQMVQQLGLPVEEIPLIPTGGTGSRLAAMNAGGITSTLLLPPVNVRAVEQGYHQMGYIPELLGEDYYFSFTAIIVRESWAEQNREALIGYLRARDDALRWLDDPANREEAIRILAERTDETQELAAETYDMIFGSDVPAFAERIGVSRDAGVGVIDGLRVSGLVHDDTLDIEDFVDDSYAQAAREGRP